MSDLMNTSSFAEVVWQASGADYVNQLACSPDGNLLASACADGSVTVLTVEGTVLWREIVHGLGATALAWSSDSLELASGGQDGRIIIWDALSGNQKIILAGGKGWVEKISWSAQGILAGITGRELKLWTANGERVSDFEPSTSTLTGLEWQTDGSLLTGGYSQVSRWYPTKSKPVKTYSWKGSILSLSTSPNGAIIAAGSQEGAIHFWRIRKGTEFQMDGYDGKVRLISWSSNSRFFFTSGGTALIIWDCKGRGPEGTRPDYQPCHQSPITALAAHPDLPVVASGAEDGSIFVYDALNKRAIGNARQNDAISQVIWHPSKPILFVGSQCGQVQGLTLKMME